MRQLFTMIRLHGKDDFTVAVGPEGNMRQHGEYWKKVRSGAGTHPTIAEVVVCRPTKKMRMEPPKPATAAQPVQAQAQVDPVPAAGTVQPPPSQHPVSKQPGKPLKTTGKVPTVPATGAVTPFASRLTAQ